jgi:hypothetical protein
MYNYYNAMDEDIRNYVTENVDLTEYANDRDGLETVLSDELWTVDSVTGNGSGSYTFNTWTARDYVTENMDLLRDALTEFSTDTEIIAEKFLDNDWEYFDVTIRCYLLNQVLSEVLDHLEEEGAFEDEDEETT